MSTSHSMCWTRFGQYQASSHPHVHVHVCTCIVYAEFLEYIALPTITVPMPTELACATPVDGGDGFESSAAEKCYRSLCVLCMPLTELIRGILTCKSGTRLVWQLIVTHCRNFNSIPTCQCNPVLSVFHNHGSGCIFLTLSLLHNCIS